MYRTAWQALRGVRNQIKTPPSSLVGDKDITPNAPPPPLQKTPQYREKVLNAIKEGKPVCT